MKAAKKSTSEAKKAAVRQNVAKARKAREQKRILHEKHERQNTESL